MHIQPCGGNMKWSVGREGSHRQRHTNTDTKCTDANKICKYYKKI